jgi:uncharacterized protein YnzC (UPF0291/DUF896 family)
VLRTKPKIGEGEKRSNEKLRKMYISDIKGSNLKLLGARLEGRTS